MTSQRIWYRLVEMVQAYARLYSTWSVLCQKIPEEPQTEWVTRGRLKPRHRIFRVPVRSAVLAGATTTPSNNLCGRRICGALGVVLGAAPFPPGQLPQRIIIIHGQVAAGQVLLSNLALVPPPLVNSAPSIHSGATKPLDAADDRRSN